jgi:hypothetical protein
MFVGEPDKKGQMRIVVQRQMYRQFRLVGRGATGSRSRRTGLARGCRGAFARVREVTTNTVKIKLVCNDEALDKAYGNCAHTLSAYRCVIAQAINDACVTSVTVSAGAIHPSFYTLSCIDTPRRIANYIRQFDKWVLGHGERPKPRNFVLEVPKEWIQ